MRAHLTFTYCVYNILAKFSFTFCLRIFSFSSLVMNRWRDRSSQYTSIDTCICNTEYGNTHIVAMKICARLFSTADLKFYHIRKSTTTNTVYCKLILVVVTSPRASSSLIYNKHKELIFSSCIIFFHAFSCVRMFLLSRS